MGLTGVVHLRDEAATALDLRVMNVLCTCWVVGLVVECDGGLRVRELRVRALQVRELRRRHLGEEVRAAAPKVQLLEGELGRCG